jgi:hypothetical protein
MVSKFFWLPRNGACHIFWKALDNGFLKTYDIPPFCGYRFFFVIAMLAIESFLSLQG